MWRISASIKNWKRNFLKKIQLAFSQCVDLIRQMTINPHRQILSSAIALLINGFLLFLADRFGPFNNIDCLLLVVSLWTHIVFVIMQHHVNWAVYYVDGKGVPPCLHSWHGHYLFIEIVQIEILYGGIIIFGFVYLMLSRLLSNADEGWRWCCSIEIC